MTELVKKRFFFNVNKVGHFKYINSVLRFFDRLFTRKTGTNFLGGGSTKLFKSPYLTRKTIVLPGKPTWRQFVASLIATKFHFFIYQFLFSKNVRIPGFLPGNSPRGSKYPVLPRKKP